RFFPVSHVGVAKAVVDVRGVRVGLDVQLKNPDSFLEFPLIDEVVAESVKQPLLKVIRLSLVLLQLIILSNGGFETIAGDRLVKHFVNLWFDSDRLGRQSQFGIERRGGGGAKRGAGVGASSYHTP